MSSARRRWLAGAGLVAVGWLVTPQPVPVYDGIGAPDEPYRFVKPPEGAAPTAEPTTARATTPVKDGVSVNGLNVATAESGPQFSIYMPPGGMASTGSTITVTATPVDPEPDPSGAVHDGNAYEVALTDPAGPVTLTDKARVSSLYLRATTAKQPGPSMYFRSSSTDAWEKLPKTTRGGADIYVTAFHGPGQYALAFGDAAEDKGRSVLPLVLVGGVVILVGGVVAVRMRSVSA